MMKDSKNSKSKHKLHPRNKHQERYDLDALAKSHPALKPLIEDNKYGNQSINFFDPAAVKALNTALLKHHYDIKEWNIPDGYLCPPVPGRADYIHYIADLLAESNNRKIPRGEEINVFDIGVGANCIYPIIGHKEYGWSFIGTEIDKIAFDSAKAIVKNNGSIQAHVKLRLQTSARDIFFGVLDREERIDVCLCNPPFHANMEEARAGTLRKLKNLKGKKSPDVVLNFGGQEKELCTEGGEKAFVKKIIRESAKFSENIFWFTCLLSKKSNIDFAKKALYANECQEMKIIEMGQGNKSSRIIAWTFLKPRQQKAWAAAKWV